MYTLGDIIRKSAESYQNFTATVFEGTRLTYRELNERTNQFANYLSSAGFIKGDRITVLAENTHKYLELYFATAKLGMSLTPLNFRLSDTELIHIVNDSDATCVLVGEDYEDRMAGLKPNLKNVRNWISLDRKLDGYDYYEEILAVSQPDEPDVEVDENEMAILMYTGGTTGLPKGVMMSHKNLMTAFISCVLSAGFNRFDSTCFILPLFHVSFWPAMSVLMVGGKVAINRRPDLNGILQLIQDEKCTHINAVPTIYQWILQLTNPDDYDLSSLRSMTYAGSPFPPEVLKQCIRKFGNIFSQGYGMTEALGATGLSEWDHEPEGERSRLLASAGKPAPCAEIRIADPDDNLLPRGEIGEILIRGKHVMMGYWKNPDLTAEVMQGGWFHTGDMGYINDEGYLFMVDRKADMIVTGGENVYPKEVEDVLYQHPAVMECGVVSAPDDKWGERVQAVVVLKPDRKTTPEELLEFCRSNLSGYKCPKKIDIWDDLPKTPIGKIVRKDIKSRFWKGHNRAIG